MASAYRKNALGCFFLLMLVAAMNPQTATSAASNETKPASPQAASPAQTTAPAKTNEKEHAPVYESATVLKSITRLVVVDVVATDKNGAVTDLKRDDFTVLEDGKEQKLRVFNFQQPKVNTSGGALVVPP